ncbi:hypothetical protein C0J52_16461 [Blattella germanica]|nr:hypothetical protein C0J52_16461 [Blattella germanica]
MENALVVLLMCTGVFALPPDYVLNNRILLGDAQLQGGALVLLAAPAQGQLLVVPPPKPKGVEDYDEGVEDSKDWKEEEAKTEGREEHDDGQYDPKKYEGTEDYNEAAETEKSEVVEDYNEKSQDEKKYEETTTGIQEGTTNQDEKEDNSGMYSPGKDEDKDDSGKYIPGKDEEQIDDTGKYDPGKYEEKSEESTKNEEKTEDSGQYQPEKYDEKDDSGKNELGKYQHDDSGKYEPGKYEENVLDSSATNAQAVEARNSDNREGKSSEEGVEQHQKAKDAETKRETVDSGTKSSDDNGKSVHVPEEIVVGSINKPQEEKTEVKSEDDGVPAVVKVAPPVKETEVVQLAPVVYHVSPKLIEATQPQ